MARSYTFGPDGVRRIVATVRAHERGNRDMPPIKFRDVGDDGSEYAIRLASVDEAWQRGVVREVDLIFEADCEDEGSGEPETREVHNKLFDIPANSIAEIALAKNGCWYVVGVGCRGEEGSGSGCDCLAIGGEDLATLPGYDATKVQILGHETGCLKWFDTDECGSGSGS